MSMQGAQVELKAGDLIFKEGDPGGDLFFIRTGEIEVFREQQGVHVPLAVLRSGEVLGIMTCLTREPRLASARAATDVVAIVVKQAGIRSLIQSTPPWVNTVIKDFTVRIKNLDELYAKTVTRLEQASFNLSAVRLAAMLAGALGEVGALLVPGGDHAVVDVDAALGRLAVIFDVPLGALGEILAVFVDVGLIRIDPNASAMRAELGVLRRLSAFAETARRYLASAEVRRACAALAPRDLVYMTQLCEELRGRRVPVAAAGHFALSGLTFGEFSAEWVADALQRAASAALVQLEEPGPGREISEKTVSFVPQTLMTAARAVDAIRRLCELDAARDPARGPLEAPVVAQVIAESF